MTASRLTAVSLPLVFSRALPVSWGLGYNGPRPGGRQFNPPAQRSIPGGRLVFLLLFLQPLVPTLTTRRPRRREKYHATARSLKIKNLSVLRPLCLSGPRDALERLTLTFDRGRDSPPGLIRRTEFPRDRARSARSRNGRPGRGWEKAKNQKMGQNWDRRSLLFDVFDVFALVLPNSRMLILFFGGGGATMLR